MPCIIIKRQWIHLYNRTANKDLRINTDKTSICHFVLDQYRINSDQKVFTIWECIYIGKEMATSYRTNIWLHQPSILQACNQNHNSHLIKYVNSLCVQYNICKVYGTTKTIHIIKWQVNCCLWVESFAWWMTNCMQHYPSFLKLTPGAPFTNMV